MRGRVLCTAVGIVSLLFVSTRISAHHAFSSEFNPNKVVMLNGTISEISWTNPHVAIKVAVKDPAGRSELWTVRGDSPVVLERNGLSRRPLVVGQLVAVCGYGAMRGQNEMSGEQVALSSGVRMVFATTEVKSSLKVALRPTEAREPVARPKATNSSGLMTNPVGAIGNPILPMGNPIPPMANPIAPMANPVDHAGNPISPIRCLGGDLGDLGTVSEFGHRMCSTIQTEAQPCLDAMTYSRYSSFHDPAY